MPTVHGGIMMIPAMAGRLKLMIQLGGMIISTCLVSTGILMMTPCTVGVLVCCTVWCPRHLRDHLHQPTLSLVSMCLVGEMEWQG